MIFLPPCMIPYRRKTKAELAHEKHVEMANTIMNKFATFQPKKKKGKKK